MYHINFIFKTAFQSNPYAQLVILKENNCQGNLVWDGIIKDSSTGEGYLVHIRPINKIPFKTEEEKKFYEFTPESIVKDGGFYGI